MLDSGESSRRFNGVALEARLMVEGKTTETRLYATDIAHGGLFLEMANPPPLGAVLRILLAVLPGKLLPLDGRVVRVVEPDEAREDGVLPGVGIKFEGLTLASRELIESAIQTAAAQVPTEPEPLPDLPADALEALPTASAPSFLVRRMADNYKAAVDEKARRGREFFEAGKAAYASGMWVKAAAELQTALTYDPDNAEIKELAAKAHAKACIAKAATASNQGEYMESLGDRKNAGAQFREAATLAPENPVYTRKAAAYAYTEGDLKMARQWLLQSLQHAPDDADTHSLLAMVYEAAGHLQLAVKSAERALELAPGRKDLQVLAHRLKK